MRWTRARVDALRYTQSRSISGTVRHEDSEQELGLGDLKVGAKVTIEYRMSATTIEVKSEKPAMEAKPKAEKKTKK